MSLVFSDDHALYTDESCHSRCGTLKNPHNSMAIGQYMQPFTGNGDVQVHVRLQMCEKFTSWTPPPPKKQQIITLYESNNIRQLRRSVIPSAGVFVLGQKFTKSKLDIVYIIENFYNVSN